MHKEKDFAEDQSVGRSTSRSHCGVSVHPPNTVCTCRIRRGIRADSPHVSAPPARLWYRTAVRSAAHFSLSRRSNDGNCSSGVLMGRRMRAPPSGNFNYSPTPASFSSPSRLPPTWCRPPTPLRFSSSACVRRSVFARRSTCRAARPPCPACSRRGFAFR